MKKTLILSLLTLVFAAPTFAQQTKEVIAEEKVVLQAPVQPEFPGGTEGMTTYFSENVKYPKAAVDKNAQGTIYVEFIVEKNGSVSNARTLRGGNALLQAEALRVINGMSNWKPAEDGNGNIVRTQMTLPVKFTL